METLIKIKTCLECGDPIKGRTDKKFCSDHCRTAFNNRLNCKQTNYVRSVDHLLRKNRRILTSLNSTGKTKVKGVQLIEKGFDFSYFTNIHKTKDGGIYYYCYEQGYRPLEKECFLLVVKPVITHELDPSE